MSSSNSEDSISTILQRYYDNAASDYGKSIEAAFAPLAEVLVDAVPATYDARILDLGCGTGVVGRALRERHLHAAGIDFSLDILRIARQHQEETLVQGDIHRMPFPATLFDLVVANFAFNHTSPDAALSETFRVLANRGQLWFHEWGARDPLSELVSDIFVEYMIDDPTPELEDFRDQMVMNLPWDDLETVDDVVDVLQSTGFEHVNCETLIVDVAFPSIAHFIDYKLAWPARKAELAAMSAEVQRLCRSDLEENLALHVRKSGQLIWSPEIYQFKAQKP